MNYHYCTHFESVVGHCKVKQEVPGVVLRCFLNKLYKKHTHTQTQKIQTVYL